MKNSSSPSSSSSERRAPGADTPVERQSDKALPSNRPPTTVNNNNNSNRVVERPAEKKSLPSNQPPTTVNNNNNNAVVERPAEKSSTYAAPSVPSPEQFSRDGSAERTGGNTTTSVDFSEDAVAGGSHKAEQPITGKAAPKVAAGVDGPAKPAVGPKPKAADAKLAASKTAENITSAESAQLAEERKKKTKTERRKKKAKRRNRVKKHLASVVRRLESKWTPELSQQLFSEEELIDLCYRAQASFIRDSALIDVSAPVNVCGDIHGQFVDLRNIFRVVGYPPAQKYVFMGDYVDRGPFSLEVMVLLLALRLLYPNAMTLLRGNHEASDVNISYGFFREVKMRYSLALFDMFQAVFRAMPFGALIEGRVLCIHGGISEQVEHLDQIRRIHRPCRIPDFGITCDLTWSDPSADVSGFQKNPRGASSVFGPDAALAFCEKVGVDYIVRAHQVPREGYEVLAGNRVVTIFSAMRYCNMMDNNAAVLHIRRIHQDTLAFSLTVFSPHKGGVFKDKGADKVPKAASVKKKEKSSSSSTSGRLNVK